MNRFVMFIICLSLGFLLIKYTEPIKKFTGDINFAEKYLGGGGTYTLLKLIGILIIIFGFAYASGHIDMLFCKYGGAFIGGCTVESVK